MIFPIPLHEPRHALVDRCPRLEAMVALDRADVGEGFPDVSGLHRLRGARGLLSRRLPEQLDHAHQVFAAVVADVVNGMRRLASARLYSAVVDRRAVETSDYAAHDVVDIGEVTPHLAAIEQRQRSPGVERL